jgi:DNA-binding response OmpR family regulator
MKNSDYLKKMKVLLAEDDKIVQESMINVLNLFVKEVTVANNGAEALQIYESENPDIIILDIDMPIIDGINAAKRIRETDTSTPIFIVTSFKDINHIQEAIPLMLVEYIIKPLKFEQIRDTLLKCVDFLDKQGLLLYTIDKKTVYNKISGELEYSDKDKVVLPKREKELLDLFIKNENRLLQKSYLEDVLFDLECNEGSLKNLIYRLKKRLNPEIIVNVKDMGYMFVTKKE